ncbi:MAG: pyridoxal phosphate-dependent aminotransferase [Bryobacteraceae bacterium]|nr:pyridoxal phosphate-dependent aminotransferase [Bryobacteraceae bacterium]
MSFPQDQLNSFLDRGFTRRQAGRIATVLTAGATLPFYNEYAMAQDAERRMQRTRGPMPPDAVRISSNENPLGPCKEGLEALTKVAQYGGRYQPFGEQGAFVQAVSEAEGVKPGYVAAFAGSSDPLHRSICAYVSPTRSMVMADPGYGGNTATFVGAKLHRVALRSDYTHDVEAMLKKDPEAGIYYVCNPNNPSGTITPRKDIEYLLANKRKDAIVLLDEAYIHLSDTATPGSDLVAADKDVIVLRTFSKLYGMAGLRAGFALGRPDLLQKMMPYGSGMLPITGLACATASLKVKTLIAERRNINKEIREDTLAFLEKKKISYVPSQTNFFMMETNRPGAEVVQAFAAEKVFIGRVWPAWPTKVRVSVGTQDEMNKFKSALEKVMA